MQQESKLYQKKLARMIIFNVIEKPGTILKKLLTGESYNEKRFIITREHCGSSTSHQWLCSQGREGGS
jgi:hypothetical protein